MAELILTDEEKATESYLEWDDAAIGKAVKHVALLFKDEYGQDAMWSTMAAHLLIDMAVRVNSTETTLTLTGATKNDVAIGDWKITIKRIKAAHLNQKGERK